MDEIYKPETLAERLKELRMEKGIGQNRLAKELGLSNASISYWENGKQEPSASAIFKLANFFEVSADYLIGLKDYK
ncbi:MAG: helix-turn-helix transcriptional regulator [Eubacteriales bacterium]|nr:helix-turn-helix domain-containing protein [Christensenellaceae bacterium]MCI7583315.1 helix-turn-helix domain-containing protein [Christensenellaceae bacterium]MDD7092388.1 helix-turn-helix transcriptional regulator [Christensenellaceae bacterium]MDY3241355.1 helix-turn-helix transcriptional regulator [Eubacteriales bacterium]MDY6078346.1 helix-turn-helix transcriptional regulator [Eubacteriales bacterium]